ncbi:hypothetical protein [Nocardioides lianchengensis]|uniref:Amine oxidase n=1 Tax=Nocardioides lianchengensis TaxID=1045774 RepID=A0A1G7B5W9_9ACTN|nr:hypothetical protein [Nocardioides lianchengensis]NYG10112.1 hypothetical protein [Nocardioides lianchengensis]SDE22257.1 Copper amine oxidase, enzyme domain [Nocardioides lianchengensis]
MRTDRLIPLVLGLALAAPTATAVPAYASMVVAPAEPGLGCGSAEVTRTLASGSAWRMCARIDPIKGLVLEQLQFRPATGARETEGWLPVVDSLYLAQLVVPYDSGAMAFNDITGYGFGDYQLLAQDDQLCPGSTLPVEQAFMFGPQLVERTIPGICLTEVADGLGWASHESNDPGDDRYVQQGRSLEISSVTKISWYEYQQKITLSDQGAITVGLGATGDLAPQEVFYPEDPTTGWPIGPDSVDPTTYATSHWHNAVYRVDFGIGSGDQQVEQWDYEQTDPLQPARLEGVGTTRTEAFQAPDDADPQTWWRVLNPTSVNRDGHPRSYEIVNEAIQNPHDALTRPKVSFTNDHACQEYASDNLNVGCPGLSVPDYVAAETAPLTDPVAWVNVGFHHIDRDEDQSPMPTHWQEFSLVPRDLLAQQATTPPERSCVNGGPVTDTGSCAAINVVPPQVVPDATPITVGTVLRTGHGAWRATRSPLSFQVQWLRDGQPIMGSHGLGHTVTTADQGHRLQVRVDASGYRLVPGTATSAELLVPSRPGPSPTTQPTTQPTTHPQPPRIAVHLGLAASRESHPRLRIRVRGRAGAATGTVVVRGPGGWKRILSLRKGQAVVLLPRAMAVRKVRVVVRYRGDERYLPTRRALRLR